jgi:hypothetical protein
MKKVLGVLLLLAAPAAADEIVLRNGSVFSGLVVDHGERVSVQMDYGTMTFRKIDIREIRRTEDPLKDLEKKVAVSASPQQLFETAMWARDRGLAGRSNELCEKVIALDPGHEGARKALGYERHEGQWLRGDDLMVARNFIRHQGKWLKRETVEQLLAQEAAEVIEVEREKTLRQAAHFEREVALQKVAVERERLEVERERIKRSQWWSSGYAYPFAQPVLPPGCVGPSAHPGYGPGRTLPPVPDRTYPSWTHSPMTPLPVPPPATTTRGGPPLKAN